LGQFASAIFEEGLGEEMESEEAKAELRRRQSGFSLAEIARLKSELEKGVSTASDDWTEGSTKFRLMEICELQTETGILLEADYVRETAISSLTNPGTRGVVLLANTLAGDDGSLDLGVRFLREGLEAENLGWDDASQALAFVSEIITSDPDKIDEFGGIALDLLARLRQWKGALDPYTSEYAVAAAELAITFRDAANQQ